MKPKLITLFSLLTGLALAWVWRVELLLIVSALFSGPRVLRVYSIDKIQPEIRTTSCEIKTKDSNGLVKLACIKLSFALAYSEIPSPSGKPANWTIEPGIDGPIDRITKLTLSVPQSDKSVVDVTDLLVNDEVCVASECSGSLYHRIPDFVAAFNKGQVELHHIQQGISFFMPASELPADTTLLVQIKLSSGRVLTGSAR